MKNLLIQMCAGLLLAASVVNVHAQPAGTAVPVTADNFRRAESDMYLAGFVKEGGFGKFFPTVTYRSKTRACGPTATRSIRSRCSISMRGQ